VLAHTSFEPFTLFPVEVLAHTSAPFESPFAPFAASAKTDPTARFAPWFESPFVPFMPYATPTKTLQSPVQPAKRTPMAQLMPLFAIEVLAHETAEVPPHSNSNTPVRSRAVPPFEAPTFILKAPFAGGRAKTEAEVKRHMIVDLVKREESEAIINFYRSKTERTGPPAAFEK
jgi:hypothetical protein